MFLYKSGLFFGALLLTLTSTYSSPAPDHNHNSQQIEKYHQNTQNEIQQQQQQQQQNPQITGSSSNTINSISSHSAPSGQHTPYIGSFSNPAGADSQHPYTRTAHFYAVQQHPGNWNRDTYADAASQYGYSGPNQADNQNSESFLSEYGNDGEGLLGGLFGGLGGGLSGLLGLKGLKGIGLLGLIKFGIPLLGLVLLPMLLLLPLILLFVPVPVITIPQPGRAFAKALNFGELMTEKVGNLARKVAESEKCVERMSCEISKMGKGTFVDRTLKKFIKRFEVHLPKTFKRIARVYMEDNIKNCKRYNCPLMDNFGNKQIVN